jgi:hypothetical protein
MIKFKSKLFFFIFNIIILKCFASVPSCEQVFTKIYNNEVLGQNEKGQGYSAPNSTIKNGDPYMVFLKNFIKENNIKSVVEVSCSFSKHIKLNDVDYFGVDIVKHVIEKDKKKFSSIRFVDLDAVKCEFPKTDLLICKDVLQHLPNEDIKIFLKKLKNFKNCLICNEIDIKILSRMNQNIKYGSYRNIDLSKPPFNVEGKKVLTYKDGNFMSQVFYIKNLNIEKKLDKTVLVAILARNKAHVLLKFLKCIEDLDYDKKLIGIYINTNNNIDNTTEILQNWMKKNENKYRFFVYENFNVKKKLSNDPHAWGPGRFKVLAKIRNKSLKKTKEFNCDYYFVVDCDNFINPCTLKELIKKNKPIIAPMLLPIPAKNSFYSNFFYAVTKSGYYKNDPAYYKIFSKSKKGTFKVPVVHCTYLIDSKYIDKLNYVDRTNHHEFIIFSKNARKNNVDQYICNEKIFGTLLKFNGQVTLEEEKKRFKKIDFKKYSPLQSK